jgi:multicomponent Na+:H+ antiporter subunit E
LFFGRFFIENVHKLLQPKRYFWFFAYLVVFIWECIKANLDVAYRVLHPAMPIRPGIVKVKTTLKSELARTLLANSITMTPGTITVDIIDDYFYIHWIYVRSEDPEVYTEMIMGTFEKYIKRIIE